jgi:hypothetical protein
MRHGCAAARLLHVKEPYGLRLARRPKQEESDPPADSRPLCCAIAVVLAQPARCLLVVSMKKGWVVNRGWGLGGRVPRVGRLVGAALIFYGLLGGRTRCQRLRGLKSKRAVRRPDDEWSLRQLG